MFRPDPIRSQLRCVLRAPLLCALGLFALAGCASPDQPLPGATAALPGAVPDKPPVVAPWRTRASAATEAVRALSEPEGELVMASAIAAHEMRRP